jgi:predicted Zn-ribbon and HTH transcriptional regulator
MSFFFKKLLPQGVLQEAQVHHANPENLENPVQLRLTGGALNPARMDRMQCPRCHSQRIQRDYDDAVFFIRIFGLHKLLCNNCGLVFKGFDPLGAHEREPSEKVKHARNRRRGPRFYAHLPTGISLIDGAAQAGKVSYSQPSRGHCETISKFGMRLSLVGARFPEAELSRIGRLLFIRIDLPEGSIEAVVTVVTSERAGEEGKKKWLLGVNIHQMSDDSRERLAVYLAKRAREEPVIISD